MITIKRFEDPLFRREVYEMLIKNYEHIVITYDHNGMERYMCCVIENEYDFLPVGVSGQEDSLDSILPELVRPAFCTAEQESWYGPGFYTIKMRLRNCKQALDKVNQIIKNQ